MNLVFVIDVMINIHDMFGQIPDVLEAVWIQATLEDIEEANTIIDEAPKSHLGSI